MTVGHKSYNDLQFLPVPNQCWNDLLIDLVIRLSFSTDWKRNSYDAILIIVDWLTKIIHYKLVKTAIDVVGLAEIIINVVVKHYDFSKLILSNWWSLFMLKFSFLLCYFFDIKLKLSISFYPQTEGSTKRQNSKMKVYLYVFVNWEQNNWARLLPIAKFAYNNVKNISTDFTLFKFNCGLQLYMSFKNEVNSCSRFCFATKLAKGLRKLMAICQQNLLYAQKL